jgi:cellulose synthase/poly-beta-1,6-N-acetylglucosamine synthase-like glycosyltransferase
MFDGANGPEASVIGPQQAGPTVSVVVPAYNSQATIGRCIESLLAQEFPPEGYEVIVVDNNSSDNTHLVVQQYPVRLGFESVLQSPGAARNRGMEMARGPILAFIDADCVADPTWLTNLTAPFLDPAVGVVGGRILSQEPNTGLVEAFLATVKRADAQRYHAGEPMGFPTGNVAYRRAALDPVGPFDAAMPWGEDIDLAWRVQAVAGFQGVYVDDAVVYHKHRSTVTGLLRQYWKYGTSEIVLTTLYRGAVFHRRTPRYQFCRIAQHVRALGTYCASFAVRLFRWRRWRSDRLYLAWPLLWFVLESGLLLGRIDGLLRTGFFRRNPYPTDTPEVRRHLPADELCSQPQVGRVSIPAESAEVEPPVLLDS